MNLRRGEWIGLGMSLTCLFYLYDLKQILLPPDPCYKVYWRGREKLSVKTMCPFLCPPTSSTREDCTPGGPIFGFAVWGSRTRRTTL